MLTLRQILHHGISKSSALRIEAQAQNTNELLAYAPMHWTTPLQLTRDQSPNCALHGTEWKRDETLTCQCEVWKQF